MALSKTDLLLKNLRKQFGEDSARKLSEIPPVARISTGLPTLDIRLGGGLPLGRIIEIFGPTHGGKTTLGLTIVKEFQKRNGTVLYIDAEAALHQDVAKNIGVDLDNVMLVEDSEAETVFDIIKWATKQEVNLVVLDSLAFVKTRKQIESKSEEITVADLARLVGNQLPAINASLKGKSYHINDRKNLVLDDDDTPTGTTLVIINQERDQIGGYMPGKTTPGGNAPKYASTVRLRVAPGRNLKPGTEQEITECKITIKKNKVGGKGAMECVILGSKGFDQKKDRIEAFIEKGIITSKGAGIFLIPSLDGKEETKIRGKDKAAEFINSNTELYEMFYKRMVDLLQEEARNPGKFTDLVEDEEEELMNDIEDEEFEVEEDIYEEEE